MPVEITDSEIAYAEQILLPPGKQFDGERRAFIRCLHTIDLQAVPGSGKTTALLAKLLILERHLPFVDGSGILVLSHTNAAVNEIKQRIGKHCPRLFSYPNFVGTIQSFVDSFLAIPYYISLHGKRPLRIDNDIYHHAASRFSRCFFKHFTHAEQNRAKQYLNQKRCCASFRLCLNGNELGLAEDIGGKPLSIKKPNSQTDWSPAEKQRIAEWLTLFKQQIMNAGVLCFDDAYLLAECAMSKTPSIIRLLRRRFTSVFVDEMQDMAAHQYNLLERLYFQAEGCNFQRIGDKNQAIFGGKHIPDVDVWSDRNEVFTLSNSQRLSGLNARIVEAFAISHGTGFAINGMYGANIKPHILVYDDATYRNVIEQFAQILKKFYAQGIIEQNVPKIFKAIAWNAVWSEVPSNPEGKLRLIDYCPTFRPLHNRQSKEFDCLADYLHNIDRSDPTLFSAKKAILHALVRALSIEDILDQRTGRSFTASTLLSYLKEAEPHLYERCNLRLFQHSRSLVCGRIERPLAHLRAFIPRFLRHLGKTSLSSKAFIEATASTSVATVPAERLNLNIMKFDDIEVQLGTVHSVKGQTHTATLYLESFFNKKYESERLAEQFKGNALAINVKGQIRDSAKMVYVGFSRPTHLLCFAVHKARFEQVLGDLDPAVWEIIKLFAE